MSGKKKGWLVFAVTLLALCAGIFFIIRQQTGESPEELLQTEEIESEVELPRETLSPTLEIGGKTVDRSAESLQLKGEEISLPELQEKLAELPALRTLELDELRCSPAELQQLREGYPHLEIRYTVKVLGESVPEDTSCLNLTALHPEELEETVSALLLLPQLREVDLTDAEGGNLLDPSDVALLQKELPNVLFRYRFPLFGQEVSTETERIEFIRAEIGNEGLQELRVPMPTTP